MTAFPYGFRIVGACSETRRLVDSAAAFAGYAAADDRAEVEREGYLSAFQFGEDFREFMHVHGTPKGFAGPCWASWVWFDLDRDDLDAALADARRLAAFLSERYALDDDALLTFFSGAKGVHLGLPTAICSPDPSPTFHRVARRFAERLAELAGVRIDSAVYDRIRPFRAPNSRHPKTGIHKRRLTTDELMGLSLAAILDLARTPVPFDLPSLPGENAAAKADWHVASAAAHEEADAKARRSIPGPPKLNRTTREFLHDGAPEGQRSVRLFRAAANLAEFGCPGPLAHELLTEPALDSGLSPSETRRQIDCGLAHVGPVACDDPAKATETPAVASSPDLRAQLAGLWGRPATSPTVPPIIAAAQDVLGAVELDDDFPFGANAPGPYGKEGGRR